MSSSAVTKKSQQQVTKPVEPEQQLEAKETSAKASASAGLNLNVFGALSGAFSGKSMKNTEEDGSSTEYREEQAHVKGAGAANMNARGVAAAEGRNAQARQAIKSGEE